LISLIDQNERQIVVLSAVAGTTNELVAICKDYTEGKNPAYLIESLNEKYEDFIGELFVSNEFRVKAKELIDAHFATMSSLSTGGFTPIHVRVILAQGELLSTHLFHYHVQEKGLPSVLLPALDFMKIDEDSEPVVPYIAEKLNGLLAQYPG